MRDPKSSKAVTPKPFSGDMTLLDGEVETMEEGFDDVDLSSVNLPAENYNE